MTTQAGRTMTVYKSYNFTDKDPVIDKIRTIVQDSGESYADIAEHSGVSIATLYNWFEGDTKRPRYSSLEAVARSLGMTLDFVPYSARSRDTAAVKTAAARVAAHFSRIPDKTLPAH